MAVGERGQAAIQLIDLAPAERIAEQARRDAPERVVTLDLVIRHPIFDDDRGAGQRHEKDRAGLEDARAIQHPAARHHRAQVCLEQTIELCGRAVVAPRDQPGRLPMLHGVVDHRECAIRSCLVQPPQGRVILWRWGRASGRIRHRRLLIWLRLCCFWFPASGLGECDRPRSEQLSDSGGHDRRSGQRQHESVSGSMDAASRGSDVGGPLARDQQHRLEQHRPTRPCPRDPHHPTADRKQVAGQRRRREWCLQRGAQPRESRQRRKADCDDQDSSDARQQRRQSQQTGDYAEEAWRPRPLYSVQSIRHRLSLQSCKG